MQVQSRPIRIAEEINTFCPVRFFIGSRHFDGLLDTVDSKGGTFFILTEEEQPHYGTAVRHVFETEGFGDLILGTPDHGIRVACRIRGIHIDQDGLFAYIGLDFIQETEIEKHRLEIFVSSLW
jgi:hypothetical protein